MGVRNTPMTTPAVPLRVFVAGLAHETNSFSPLPTSLRNFEDTICYRPNAGTGRDDALGFPGYGDAIRTTQKRGDVVIWSGDPLELSSAPEAVWIDGVRQPLDNHQTKLRDRYRSLEREALPEAYRK